MVWRREAERIERRGVGAARVVAGLRVGLFAVEQLEAAFFSRKRKRLVQVLFEVPFRSVDRVEHERKHLVDHAWQ